MKLLTSQKDSLYDLIEKIGLSPNQFEFSEMPSKRWGSRIATELRFKKSDFYFLFETETNNPLTQANDQHYAVFCPGFSSYIESETTLKWSSQLHRVSTWLENIVREITSPNKWERLESEIQSININFDNEEDKFSVQEYEDLQRKILILKEGIPSIGLLSEQERIINEKLDYLVESAKNMKKFDWKSLFIGIMFSIIIQLEVTPDNAKSLLSLIKQVFHSFLLP